MTRALTVASAVAALVALAVGVATAHKGTAKTKVTFTTEVQGRYDKYRGQVSSPSGETFNTRCVRRRQVVVTHKGFVLGSDLTSDGGKWVVVIDKATDVVPPRGDELVATVRRRFARNNIKHKHICAAATATAKAP